MYLIPADMSLLNLIGMSPAQIINSKFVDAQAEKPWITVW